MEYRRLGSSGLKVPALTLGTGTFGGNTELFKAWGTTGVPEATRLIDVCLEHGLNMFDSADIYSKGQAEHILGKAIAGKRDKVIISTKATFPSGPGPNEIGSSRYHLTHAIEGSLKRMDIDHIDLFQLHGFDAQTPVEETIRTLDDMVRAGKIRYIGCSNYSGWHLMKSLAVSDKLGAERFVAHQAYYSLIGREYEWELMPLALDQGVGTVVWSPLGWARLTGKIRRGQEIPDTSRMHNQKNKDAAPPVDLEKLYDIIDELEAIGSEIGKSIAQVALNWLLRRPSISSLIIGARNEEQLMQNLDVVTWQLSQAHIDRLDEVSKVKRIYPYWHQAGFARNPFPTK